MILSREEADLRLNSPENLINRMRQRMSPELADQRISRTEVNKREPLSPFIGLQENLATAGDSPIVSMPPSVDDLIDDVENKLTTANDEKNLKALRSDAIEVLASSVKYLKNSIIEVVDSPKTLSRIATDMSKIINADDGNKKVNNFNQVIVYRPVAVNENHYEAIRVHE